MHARSWQARGHVGAVLNHSRSLMRRIVFSTDMRPGTPDAEEAIHRLHRLLRLFFALLMQDCRLNQDLERVPSDVLTPKEKDELAHVRRRPLMVIGWCQATIRRLAREGHISERISLRMEDHLEAISQAYHGCTKIRSQPMPFSYSQVLTTVRAAILSVADALLGGRSSPRCCYTCYGSAYYGSTYYRSSSRCCRSSTASACPSPSSPPSAMPSACPRL